MTGDGMIKVDDDSMLLRRTELENLQDRLYVLRSAVEILEGAIQEGAGKCELINVAREVVAAAGDLDKLWISP